jgi:hypothetical protein
MQVSQKDLEWAVAEGIVSKEQSDALWAGLLRQNKSRQKFDFAHVAYYFGAMIVISAMAWFMTEAWDSLGGAGIAAIALIYAIGFGIAGHLAWSRYELRVPGGLLFTVTVWMTPLVIYGLERAAGMWPQGDPGSYRDYHIWVRGSWIAMEVGTIVVGAVALRLRRFPFLTFPIAFALWYMSMDLTPLIVGAKEFSWDERAWVSVFWGGVVTAAAYLIDLRDHSEDYALWCYFFGLTAFWSGLSSLDSHSEASKFIYFLVNLGLICMSLFLRRRIFLVFGAMGVFGYLGHLAWSVFKDSMLFPFVLTAGGLSVIAIGICWQRKHMALEEWFDSRIPLSLQRLVPPRARVQ